ncbi:hypothetical protein CALCODRAFT_89774 [Calocera cornea HHB12733]|uniref:DASH complex subunit DAD3 n=1 Tax=Calocera cornea HHB12733 TaxID=1353952 RepID=A0A165DC34_9BASI|nr:hypothetical protein CALCODRAFT_89774 [Calocera cornea HHB12733]
MCRVADDEARVVRVRARAKWWLRDKIGKRERTAHGCLIYVCPNPERRVGSHSGESEGRNKRCDRVTKSAEELRTTRPRRPATTMTTTAPTPVVSTEDDAVLVQVPYASHPALSPLEGEVLWEYAKTAGLVRKLAGIAKDLGGRPNEELSSQLRVLERKMGLVLTLFKASVWAVIVEGEEAEQEMLAKEEYEARLQVANDSRDEHGAYV